LSTPAGDPPHVGQDGRVRARLASALRSTADALREAVGNDGIRRLEVSWTLGIAADAALTIMLLVAVYNHGGVVATGLLGAVRMAPAVISGTLTGAILQRVRGHRLLLAIALVRAASASAVAFLVMVDAPVVWLFVVAAIVSAAGAPVRPAQATLLPAVARSPGELVAANAVTGTGEGAGSLVGPLVAGGLIAAGELPVAAALAAAAFLGTGLIIAGLRFEQSQDASGGGLPDGRGLRLREGLAALRRRSVPAWTMLAVFGQVLTRGLLNVLTVVAAVELLSMGDGGVGVLSAALGFGGLLGAILAMSLASTRQLLRTEAVALAWWGAPIAFIALAPIPIVALAAMAGIGLANAVFDVAIYTIFQRGSSNAERAPVFSVFEGVAGLGLISGSLLGPVLVASFGPRGALAVAASILPILALIIYNRTSRADQISVVDEPLLRLLRAVDVFNGLPLTGIERLAEGAVPVRFPAGAELMRQGDQGDRFIVVDTGEVEIEVNGRSIRRVGHAAGVGEIALIRRSPRTATAIARTDVTGFAFDGGTFMAAVSGPTAAVVTEQIAAAPRPPEPGAGRRILTLGGVP
jgi:MFS family permease